MRRRRLRIIFVIKRYTHIFNIVLQNLAKKRIYFYLLYKGPGLILLNFFLQFLSKVTLN